MTSLLTSLLTLPNWTWPGLISVRRGGSLPGEACRALVWWLMFYEVCFGFCDHKQLIH
jgi:Cys-tRNA synthase (O-phospho-L-seryl-tRNA:Cys-tRNA synthase)